MYISMKISLFLFMYKSLYQPVHKLAIICLLFLRRVLVLFRVDAGLLHFHGNLEQIVVALGPAKRA